MHIYCVFLFCRAVLQGCNRVSRKQQNYVFDDILSCWFSSNTYLLVNLWAISLKNYIRLYQVVPLCFRNKNQNGIDVTDDNVLWVLHLAQSKIHCELNYRCIFGCISIAHCLLDGEYKLSLMNPSSPNRLTAQLISIERIITFMPSAKTSSSFSMNYKMPYLNMWLQASNKITQYPIAQ